MGIIKKIFDFHTHTFLSDGEYGPMETAQRAKSKGYSVIGFSDHVDFGTYENTIAQLKKAAKAINSSEMGIKALVGVEITHVPPSQIKEIVELCKKEGAEFTIIHGETPIEPVIRGTNRAAIEGGADILAHPGFITEEDVELAVRKGVFLEISTRKKQQLANPHVINLIRKYGAPFLINSDAHEDGHLLTPEFLEKFMNSYRISYDEWIKNIGLFFNRINFSFSSEDLLFA